MIKLQQHTKRAIWREPYKYCQPQQVQPNGAMDRKTRMARSHMLLPLTLNSYLSRKFSTNTGVEQESASSNRKKKSAKISGEGARKLKVET